jgi:signal transduction histidine kinase/ligand-binding sensor domain-containing protein
VVVLARFILCHCKFLKWCLLISLYFAFGTAVTDAQQRYSRFDHLTSANGLSSNRIWVIHRDSKDYLWISTDVGLDRFDSYDVKKYRYDEKIPGSISSDIILSIFEDHDKKLWFGTYNGLNLYDAAKDKFSVYKNDPADTTSLNGNDVNTIIEDLKGNLWIMTDGNCLNRWDPIHKSFKRFKFDIFRSGFYSRPSRMVAKDSKGFLWVVSMGIGIYRFDPATGEFLKHTDSSIDFGSDCYKSLYIDEQDKIWITTDGNGFYSFDPATSRFVKFGSDGDGRGTNQRILLDIIPEDKDHLLIGADQGGINRFNKITRSFEYFMYDNSNNEGLNNNGVWCFHRDREGILWLGTSGGGINYINPRQNKFKVYRHTDSPTSLSYSFTGCFYEDHEGMIWIGTDGGGVNVFDPVKGSFKAFKNIKSDPYSISGNVIRSITEDKDHDIWIATWDEGLNRYDRKTNKFYRFLPEKDNPASISGRSVWNIILDHDDILWLACYTVGVDQFRKNLGVIRRFRFNTEDSTSISSDQSFFFYEDFEENMWICTENGLNRYDRKTNSFRIYNFPDNELAAFYRDKQGKLWVGSNTKGLYFCNEDGSIIKTYNISNGLLNNRIQAIVADNSGNLWLSTNGGISRFDPKTEKFRNYTKEDGLQSDQFFQQSFLKTSKGELYFGGFNGFNSFFPDSLKDNDFIPNVYITDFQIFNKPVPSGVPGSQFETHISEAKELKLEWNQSVFSFSFSAINYTAPGKNQYAYMMEGFETDWNYTNASRRYVTYTNLNPGEYTFKVKASNNDGVWNNKGVSLRIIILPPWWKTLWFILTSVSMIIFLVVAVFLLRVRSLKNQKKLLEKLILLKTAELQEKNDDLIRQAVKLNNSNLLLEERQKLIEAQRKELLNQKEELIKMNDELHELNASKDKFFSIIAHDLKNPFNIIIGLSGILKEDITSGNHVSVEESVSVINSSAVQTYRLLENLLDWANSQRGKLSFNLESIKLNEILREEFNMLDDIAKGKNIVLRSYVDNSLVVVADRNMIKTIFRNLISNAIKFTHRNGIVEVRAVTGKNNTEISVSDNGIGMSEEVMAKLFRIDANLTTRGTENEKGTGLGLFLCKEFVEKHGGKISVESKPGKGSVFRFVLATPVR